MLNKICEDYNNTPIKTLGWIKPNDINNVYDSVTVQKAQIQHNIVAYKEPDYKKQLENQNGFVNKSKKNDIKKGSYVYLDFKEDLFGKSFDVQVFLD